MSSLLFFAKTVTPLHVGAGRSASSDIDLPVARERLTNWPVVPGSGVKGVLRDADLETLTGRMSLAEAERDPGFIRTYGQTTDDEGQGSQAGSLIPTDLRLLVMGVRSFHGGFAWVTCPLAIERLKELAESCGLTLNAGPAQPPSSDSSCLISSSCKVADPQKKRIFLEDIDLNCHQADLTALAELLKGPLGRETAEQVAERLVVLDNTTFTFLTETATEVTTKVTLDFATKSAKQGMLRTEESVPCDSLFAGALLFQRVRGVTDVTKERDAFLAKDLKALRFGGKSTTGHGICRVTFTRGGNP